MDAAERARINEAMIDLAHGDRSAFTTVFEGLWPALSAFVRRASLDHFDAEDAAQQALLKVFARISDFDVRRDGVSWAFGIAAFEVRTIRANARRRKDGTGLDGLEDVRAHGPSPEQRMLGDELERAWLETLGELSDADRETLLPSGGTAAIIPATARKRRQRALQRLRGLWRRRHA